MKEQTNTRSIYLASRYSRYPEMQEYAAELRRMGYTVTSRWIDGGHELSKEGSAEAAQQDRTRFAQEDLADLLSADTCISFTEEPRKPSTSRGGRHVEFGAALAVGERLIVCGPRENVFHCLPDVEQYDTWEQVRDLLEPAHDAVDA